MMQLRTTTLAAACVAPLFGSIPASATEAKTYEVSGTSQHTLAVRRRELHNVGSDPLSWASRAAETDSGLSVADLVRRNEQRSIKELSAEARLLSEIFSYEKLGEDWDDSGAIAPLKSSILVASAMTRAFARRGKAPTRSYPSSSGDVGLVWERNGAYADLSCFPDGSFSYYARDASGALECFSDKRERFEETPDRLWQIIIAM